MFFHKSAMTVVSLCAFFALSVGAVQSAFVDHGGKSRLSSVGINTSALSIFEQARSSFEQKYDYYGRSVHDVTWPPHSVSLDFEVETLAPVRLSPEVFLQRGGVNLGSSHRRAMR